SEGATVENQYKAIRTASGWQSTNLTPRLLTGSGGQGYKAFDTNLTRGVLSQFGPALNEEAPADYENLYTLPASTPLALTSLLAETPPGRPASGAGRFELHYAGASDDLSRVFFAANDALTEETAFAPAAADGGAAKFNLYEWLPAGGQLSLVNVKPGNAATEPGPAFAFGAGSAHAISADGKRVFWSQGTSVYVREDGEVTHEIPNPGSADFLAASTDGSRVLLDDGSLYDLEAEEAIDLTGGQGGFQGIVGQGDDLTHVYFVDTAVLTGEEENGEGDKAQAGQPNLYAWSEGAIAFVGTLVVQDNAGAIPAMSRTWSPLPVLRTAQGSPNGRFLAFLSQASLTGYDNTGPTCKFIIAGVFDPGPCAEAFLYDSATGELACASCNPSGAQPLGVTVLRRISQAPHSLTPPPYLTDSGRLYFDSRDSLSPSDTNEGVEDVYQFEPEGIGTCEREGGCISLISAGTEPVDSNLVTIDETGKNVFFTTRDQLVLKDKDELIDLYDAREGGGIPAETETQGDGCQGEACQPQPVVPDDPPPAFEGSGNVKATVLGRRPCAKGKVRRRGRCVPRKTRHHKRAAHRNGRKSR
ncbi:MAG TPA: hypothetical protein VLB12_00980, partial [Gemmatimonadales bacterium]|nr:hypothetical protein [Gemmatimonadales bacterium]